MRRGRMSLLASARSEAEAEMRDAYTALTGCPWHEFRDRLDRVGAAFQRLDTIAILYANHANKGGI